LRLKFIIGILALLLLMVGTAGAMQLTDTNVESGNIPTGASIAIDVTYDATANTITYVDNSKGLTSPGITWVAYNVDVAPISITGSLGSKASRLSTMSTMSSTAEQLWWYGVAGDTVGTNTGNTVGTVTKLTSLTATAKEKPTAPSDLIDWMQKNNFGAGGTFGQLARIYATDNPGVNRYHTVVVQLPEGYIESITPNTKGYEVGVHFVCGEFSGFVAGPDKPKPPEPPVTPIPEFPTVALPIATILGLMFVFGFRKQE
jgi:hypothetical protein